MTDEKKTGYEWIYDAYLKDLGNYSVYALDKSHFLTLYWSFCDMLVLHRRKLDLHTKCTAMEFEAEASTAFDYPSDDERLQFVEDRIEKYTIQQTIRRKELEDELRSAMQAIELKFEEMEKKIRRDVKSDLNSYSPTRQKSKKIQKGGYDE